MPVLVEPHEDVPPTSPQQQYEQRQREQFEKELAEAKAKARQDFQSQLRTAVIQEVQARYGAMKGEANYDAVFDLNADGIIDMQDIGLANSGAAPRYPTPEELGLPDINSIVDEMEREARAQFEAELEKGRQQYLLEVQGQRAKTEGELKEEFKTKLAEALRNEQESFKQQVLAQTATYESMMSQNIAAQEAQIKREAAMQGRFVTPRELIAWRQSAYKSMQERLVQEVETWKNQFQTDVANWQVENQQAFEQTLKEELDKWQIEQEALVAKGGEWETLQKSAFESQIGEWRSGAISQLSMDVAKQYQANKTSFEQSVANWKAQAQTEFQANISTWETQARTQFKQQILGKIDVSATVTQMRAEQPEFFTGEFKAYGESLERQTQGQTLMGYSEFTAATTKAQQDLATAMQNTWKNQTWAGEIYKKAESLPKNPIASAAFGHPQYSSQGQGFFLAGVVAEFESSAKGIYNLGGIVTGAWKPLVVPPTLGGGILGGLVKTAIGQATPWQDLGYMGTMPLEYSAGNIGGFVLESYFSSAAFAKAKSAIMPHIPFSIKAPFIKASGWVSEHVTEPLFLRLSKVPAIGKILFKGKVTRIGDVTEDIVENVDEGALSGLRITKLETEVVPSTYEYAHFVKRFWREFEPETFGGLARQNIFLEYAPEAFPLEDIGKMARPALEIAPRQVSPYLAALQGGKALEAHLIQAPTFSILERSLGMGSAEAGYVATVARGLGEFGINTTRMAGREFIFSEISGRLSEQFSKEFLAKMGAKVLGGVEAGTQLAHVGFRVAPYGLFATNLLKGTPYLSPLAASMLGGGLFMTLPKLGTVTPKPSAFSYTALQAQLGLGAFSVKAPTAPPSMLTRLSSRAVPFKGVRDILTPISPTKESIGTKSLTQVMTTPTTTPALVTPSLQFTPTVPPRTPSTDDLLSTPRIMRRPLRKGKRFGMYGAVYPITEASEAAKYMLKGVKVKTQKQRKR